MIPEEIFLKIVRIAGKAPSGHNTQPWLFSKEEDSIYIMPDFNRSLPIADPENRELFISLGCAAQTLMIAAKFYGYAPTLKFETGEQTIRLSITLQKAEQEEQELFSCINTRQTTRNLYDDTPIPNHDIKILEQIASDPDIHIRFLIGKNEIKKLSPYIADASLKQTKNQDFIRELIQWLRFNEKEAMREGDGLYTACIGLPPMWRSVGSFVFKNFVTAKSEEKRWLKQLHNTAAIAIFTSKSDEAEHWVKTGMSFQRFALSATKLNLSHSHLNLPCQVAEVRGKMMNELALEAGFPQLLIRLGYSQKMKFPFRRRINELIIG